MCLDLPPLGECAWGRCVNGECVCDPGVIQSEELLFQPIPGNSTIICDYNVDLVVGATIVVLSVVGSVFLLQLAALTTLKQVKRGLPILLGYILLIPALIIRLVKPLEPLWGVSYTFTTCLVLHMMVYALQVTVFLNKYVVYLERTILIRASSMSGVRFSQFTTYTSLFLVCSGSLLWFATLFVDSLKVAEIMTKLGCAVYAAACAILALAQTYLFTNYIGDVKALIASSGESQHERNRKFVGKCKRQLPRINWLRRLSMFSTAVLTTSFTMAIFLDGWLKHFVLVVYVSIILYQLCNLCVLRTFSQRYHSFWSGASSSLRSMVDPLVKRKYDTSETGEHILQSHNETSSRFGSQKPTL